MGTTLIGLLCVAICALPPVLISTNRKKNEKQFLNLLKASAQKHESIITDYEISGHYAIGIDSHKKALTFMTKTGNDIKEQFVDLSTVKDCKTVNKSRLSGKHNKIIDSLYLQLSFADITSHEAILEFYNANVSFQLNDEFQSMEKWNAVINGLIKS